MAMAEAAGIEDDVLAPLLEVKALVQAAPRDRIQARLPYTLRIH